MQPLREKKVSETKQALTVFQQIDNPSFKEQLARALPNALGTAGLTADRMVRLALTMLKRNEALQKCTPLSVMACVVEIAQLGLEPEGVLGHAYMVPFGDQCTLIVGYRGFMHLMYQSGIVGSHQTSPLVVDGVMYFTTPACDVIAVNAATGDEVWRYRHTFTSPRTGASNRGAAVAYGKVYEATDDHRVIALDQATGNVVFDKLVPGFEPPASLSQPGKPERSGRSRRRCPGARRRCCRRGSRSPGRACRRR